jgi:hypothetical protein
MTSNDLRCPQCSAHISSTADWCTLCYADLRPAPEPPPPAPVVEEALPHEPAAELARTEEPTGAEDGEGRGKHARSTPSYADAIARAGVPLDEAAQAELDARAEQMLAMLKAESSHPLAPWASRLDSTQARVIAGAVGLIGLLAVGLLAMTVVGHFI